MDNKIFKRAIVTVSVLLLLFVVGLNSFTVVDA